MNAEEKTVLLVDDEPANIQIVNSILKGICKTRIATSGEKALELANQVPAPDLILLDVMMPAMDGYEAMKKIRSNPRFNNLPIIALTAKAMQGDKEKSIVAGASDYITKPVDSNKLFSLMRVWLSV